MNKCFIPWSDHLQQIALGWFPIRKDDSYIYEHQTCAIHLHQHHCTVWIGKTCLQIRPGDITVTPPYTPSNYHYSINTGIHWCAHFMPLGKTTEKLRLPLVRRAGTHTPALIQRLRWLSEVAKMAHGKKPEFRHRRDALTTGVRELVLWLHLEMDEHEDHYGERAEKALSSILSLLEKRFERDWSVKELSTEVGLNSNYLARLFRGRHGCTISQFLLRRRIEVAQNLLFSTTLRVKEIGDAVGIPDPQKFNKAFRSVLGCSPSDFRVKFAFLFTEENPMPRDLRLESILNTRKR